MAVINLNEEIVAQEYERLVPTFEGFCGCSTCRDDVLVFALNQLRPRYVTQRRGGVLQHLRMQDDQSLADVAVALAGGFRIVMNAPRPGHESG